GGQLIFVRNSTLLELCTAPDAEAAGDHLNRPYSDVARIDRPMAAPTSSSRPGR
ncbi:MAG: hypothetical protein QOH03_1743, partial [Kribbellaceae bacterium]|nr:hypothetical protein [Kribbellaceae bacterium]